MADVADQLGGVGVRPLQRVGVLRQGRLDLAERLGQGDADVFRHLCPEAGDLLGEPGHLLLQQGDRRVGRRSGRGGTARQQHGERDRGDGEEQEGGEAAVSKAIDARDPLTLRCGRCDRQGLTVCRGLV
jgi:hypothetical protein